MYSQNQSQQEIHTGVVPAWQDWIDWQDQQLQNLSRSKH
mgnify:CR=1 FL=1